MLLCNEVSGGKDNVSGTGASPEFTVGFWPELFYDPIYHCLALDVRIYVLSIDQ